MFSNSLCYNFCKSISLQLKLTCLKIRKNIAFSHLSSFCRIARMHSPQNILSEYCRMARMRIQSKQQWLSVWKNWWKRKCFSPLFLASPTILSATNCCLTFASVMAASMLASSLWMSWIIGSTWASKPRISWFSLFWRRPCNSRNSLLMLSVIRWTRSTIEVLVSCTDWKDKKKQRKLNNEQSKNLLLHCCNYS